MHNSPHLLLYCSCSSDVSYNLTLTKSFLFLFTSLHRPHLSRTLPLFLHLHPIVRNHRPLHLHHPPALPPRPYHLQHPLLNLSYRLDLDSSPSIPPFKLALTFRCQSCQPARPTPCAQLLSTPSSIPQSSNAISSFHPVLPFSPSAAHPARCVNVPMRSSATTYASTTPQHHLRNTKIRRLCSGLPLRSPSSLHASCKSLDRGRHHRG